jgi:hypothetical protein
MNKQQINTNKMGDGNFTCLDDENYDVWEFETQAKL